METKTGNEEEAVVVTPTFYRCGGYIYFVWRPFSFSSWKFSSFKYKPFGSSVDCGHTVAIRPESKIQCDKCEHRVLYKVRVERSLLLKF